MRGTPKGGWGWLIRHMQTQTHTEGCDTHTHRVKHTERQRKRAKQNTSKWGSKS